MRQECGLQYTNLCANLFSPCELLGAKLVVLSETSVPIVDLFPFCMPRDHRNCDAESRHTHFCHVLAATQATVSISTCLLLSARRTCKGLRRDEKAVLVKQHMQMGSICRRADHVIYHNHQCLKVIYSLQSQETSPRIFVKKDTPWPNLKGWGATSCTSSSGQPKIRGNTDICWL